MYILLLFFFNRLSLTGKHLVPKSPPFDISSYHSGKHSSRTTQSEYSHLEEEIFSQDGEYEEVIAIDYKDMYVFKFVLYISE